MLTPDILPLGLLNSFEFLQNVNHSRISCALQVEVFVMDLFGPEISRLSLEVEKPLFYHLLVKPWIENLYFMPAMAILHMDTLHCLRNLKFQLEKKMLI